MTSHFLTQVMNRATILPGRDGMRCRPRWLRTGGEAPSTLTGGRWSAWGCIQIHLEVLWQETAFVPGDLDFLYEVGGKWARTGGAGTLRSREV